jgi:hypothetical protein
MFVSLALAAILAIANSFAPTPRTLVPRSAVFMIDDAKEGGPFTGTVKWYE